ncbi:MAG: META domain-containing protein [Cypionkella sp.]|uniref:META domain-containing protein n=1 Tax=Cypionkella sp. TaxID=2811411 RepID=UPI002AB8037D|nr:META domain-containing protein [Cypionkella sp.]MDZ4311152.1 META domain-containing protein [Cypionkella sp.]MDZ4391536.1 META domain-containing protein [Cypionkella sp.]
MKYLWVAALALAACVEEDKAAGPDWMLSLVDGQAVDYTATLSLTEPGRVTGQAPCNRYFADLSRDGSSFKLGMIGATRMACLQIKGEADFFQTLQGIETADEASGKLTLSGAGHQMVFVPLQN